MTLQVTVSVPEGSPYKARVQVLDVKKIDVVGDTSTHVEADNFVLDAGQSRVVTIWKSPERRIVITEE